VANWSSWLAELASWPSRPASRPSGLDEPAGPKIGEHVMKMCCKCCEKPQGPFEIVCVCENRGEKRCENRVKIL